MMSRNFVVLLISSLGMASLTEQSTTQSDAALVIFSADTVLAGVADSYAERVQGLKDRTELPDGIGLLFVFPEAAERSFWMVDTLVDLDIAFMDPTYRITRIATMKAGSADLTLSMGPAMFALEVRAGWFGEKGIGVGDLPEVIFQSDH
jgi:uncharacterized protein